MKVQKLSERLILFTDDQSLHENVVVIWTNKGPVIVDAFQTPAQFSHVEEYLKKQKITAPAMQIYTHWHTDHTLGNQKLTGVPILSHQRTAYHLESKLCKTIMAKMMREKTMPEGIKCFLPTDTFETEKSIVIGDMIFHLIHAPGHTSDSIIIYIPELEVLIAGDNLVGPEVEFFFPPSFTEDEPTGIDSLALVYQKIRQFNAKTIIPGHGWVLPPADIINLNEHRYKTVIKRSMEIMQRGLKGLISGEVPFDECLIRAWLSQVKSCASVSEQKALQENVGKVMNLMAKEFRQALNQEDAIMFYR